jgi:hypothetical protein
MRCLTNRREPPNLADDGPAFRRASARGGGALVAGAGYRPGVGNRRPAKARCRGATAGGTLKAELDRIIDGDRFPLPPRIRS